MSIRPYIFGFLAALLVLQRALNTLVNPCPHRCPGALEIRGEERGEEACRAVHPTRTKRKVTIVRVGRCINTYGRERESKSELNVPDVQQRWLGCIEPLHCPDRRPEPEDICNERSCEERFVEHRYSPLSFWPLCVRRCVRRAGPTPAKSETKTTRRVREGDRKGRTYQSYRRHRPHQSPGTMISPPPRRANPCELFKKRYLDLGKRILIGASREVATVTI